MRILFLTHYALPHIGGIETAVEALRTELSGRGHEVPHVACDALAGPGQPLVPSAAVATNDVVRVPAFSAPLEARGIPWPIFSPRLIAVLARELRRADVVHGHGYLYMDVVAGLVAARVHPRRPATVLTEHVGRVPQRSAGPTVVQDAAIASVGRASARAADALVVLNHRLAAELRALAPGRPIETIPNGVDTGTFRPAAPGERERLRRALGWDDRPRVLLVGRLTERKGVGRALAATHAAAGAFELVVVGPGKLRTTQPGVQVLGPVTRARLAELYRAADALVFPSSGEGFPISAQEAAVSGVPVVLSRDPGYGDYVAQAPGAFRLVEPTPESLCTALGDLVRRPSSAPVAAAATEAAREAFSVVTAADAHERLYRRLRGGRA